MEEELYNSQKRSNDLNLSLSLSPEERVKSEELSTGYNATTKVWELIIKYNGDIITPITSLGGFATPLLGGYAIITLPETMISAITQLPEVEYIEKPTRLYYE